MPWTRRCGASPASWATTRTSDDALRAIEFDRIKGGKAFDPSVDWFTALLADLGQA